MVTKIKKYVKESIWFVIVFFLLSSVLSLYRSTQMKIDDSVCVKDVDVVYVWATWCPVCQMTSPNIKRLSKYYKVRGIAVKSKDVREYMQKNDLDFEVEEDATGEFAKRYGIIAFPTTIFCHNEQVVMVDVGYLSTFGAMVRSFVSQF